MSNQDSTLQSLSQSSALSNTRIRSSSSANHHSAVHSGGIRKKPVSSSRHRAVSTSYAERLHHLAIEQSTAEAEYSQQQQQQQQVYPDSNLNWLTPQHSPEPSCFFQEPAPLDQFAWAAPTPPRSDSGIPSLSADLCDDAAIIPTSTTGVSSPETFAFDPLPSASDMSSLGFLLPQYASGSYSSDNNNASYSVDSGYPARSQATTTAPSQYNQTVSSSPSFYQRRPAQPERRDSELSSTGQAYTGTSRRLTGPYEPSAHEYPGHSQSIPSMSVVSPMGSPVPGPSTMAPPYRSPAMYDSQFYGSAYTTAPAGAQMYAPAPSTAYPPPPSSYGGASMDSSNRVPDGRSMSSKPKPQCWDHGCNGRQFSTFSNLLRHQREKSGAANKSYCPKCGAEFTRTTARNGHLAHDKCTKGRRLSEDRGM